MAASPAEHSFTPNMSLTTETTPVLDQHRFDEVALARFMRANVEDFVPPLQVGQVRGGMSNPTFVMSGGNGQRYVLRKKPPGELLPSAHAVDREFRVISALWETDVPVARPYVLCQNPDVIGVDFYIMGFADGRVFRHLELPELALDGRCDGQAPPRRFPSSRTRGLRPGRWLLIAPAPALDTAIPGSPN